MNGSLSRGVLVALVLIVALSPARVNADDLSDDLEDVVDRIRTLSSQIDDVTVDRSDLAARIRAADGSLGRLLSAISGSESALSRLKGEVEDSEGLLVDLRKQLLEGHARLFETRTAIAQERSGAVRAARAAYVRGRNDFAALSFAAEKVTDISVGLVYLERVSVHTRRDLTVFLSLERSEDEQRAKVAEQEGQVTVELERIDVIQADLSRVRDVLNTDKKLLEQSITSLGSLLRELDVELGEFEGELAALENERLNIKRKINVEQARQQAALAVSDSGFTRPVPGRITSAFGPRVHPILGYTRIHEGIDMAAGHGQSVKSARGGTVILARNWGGYGRTVVIDHGDGMSTLYAHLSAFQVAKGEIVPGGIVVGKAGSSGMASGAHLHFEVMIDGDPVDPVSYLPG